MGYGDAPDDSKGKGKDPLLEQLRLLLRPWNVKSAADVVELLSKASPNFRIAQATLRDSDKAKTTGPPEALVTLLVLQREGLTVDQYEPARLVRWWTAVRNTFPESRKIYNADHAQGFKQRLYTQFMAVAAVDSKRAVNLVSDWKANIIDQMGDAPEVSNNPDLRVELTFLYAILEQWLVPSAEMYEPVKYSQLSAIRDWLAHKDVNTTSQLHESETHGIRGDEPGVTDNNTRLMNKLQDLSGAGNEQAKLAQEAVMHFMATPASAWQEKRQYYENAIMQLGYLSRDVPEMSPLAQQWVTTSTP